jgi:hypothetical protein
MNDIANTTHTDTLGEIERVLVMGDLARLTPQQRTVYYNRVCESVGLNPLTRPFEYITLNGKLTLYARKDATDQLRSLRGITIRIGERAVVDDIMCVTAEATDRHGRTDSSLGAVSVGGLRGEARANALMKAETKAKRRVTLSICGLGFLDESELEGQQAEPAQVSPRAADRLLSAAAAAVPAPAEALRSIATEEPRTAPAVPSVAEADGKGDTKPAPKATPKGRGSEDLFSPDPILDFVSVEAVKSSSGEPVWKAIDANNSVYAVFDPLLVEDIATAAKNGRAMQCKINAVGKKSVIVSAMEVSE